jgi:Cadherin domain
MLGRGILANLNNFEHSRRQSAEQHSSQLNESKQLSKISSHYFRFSRFSFPSLHSQVNIDIEDINDNFPTFESSTVRISVPENVELGTPLYVVSASDRDSGKSGTVTYRLSNGGSVHSSNANLVTSNAIPSVMTAGNLFSIDAATGHLTLSQHLDFETSQRHSLIVTATDSGEPALSSNLTIFVEVQDVNDNLPIFERNEYTIKVLESTPINSQVMSKCLMSFNFFSPLEVHFCASPQSRRRVSTLPTLFGT